MARTRGEAITAPNAIAAAAAPALGVWDGAGGIYISEALIGVSLYFSRSSEVLLSVVAYSLISDTQGYLG